MLRTKRLVNAFPKMSSSLPPQIRVSELRYRREDAAKVLINFENQCLQPIIFVVHGLFVGDLQSLRRLEL